MSTTTATPVTFHAVETVSENVPIFLQDRIGRKLVGLNRKLAKLGIAPATVTFGPIIDRVERDEFGFEHTLREFETVTVVGYEARHSGWEPVAALDHRLDATEAYVAKFPGHYDTEIPPRLAHRGPVCDHCHIRIARNTTILFHNENGSWTQVGTSCVLEYIGIDPRTILMLAQAATLADDDSEAGGSARRYCTPMQYLAIAAEVTRELGFRPSSADGSNRDLVASIVYGTMKEADVRKMLPGLDADRGAADATTIAAWIAEQSSGSDFMRSAQLACRASIATERTVGILASLPHVHANAIAKAVLQTKPDSTYLGAIGAKLTVTGQVAVARTIEGHYGMKRLIVVLTAEGNRVGTFGTGASLLTVEQGNTVTMTGKVKDHEDGQYGKTTMLTLAKVTAA